MSKLLWLMAGLFLALSTVVAADENDILGIWTVGSGDARVEISRVSNGDVEGRIIWLRIPEYEAGDPEAGVAKHDRENPDIARRNDPLIGLAMLKGFHFSGDGLWKGGTIYDPKNGKTYSCKLTLTKPDVLDVRGFIGISLIGRTDTWRRYTE